MLMQDLYKVLSDDTYVSIANSKTIFSTVYNGIISNIPVSLLDSQIIRISGINLNYIAIIIA